MPPLPITEFAPAKVNLTLHVTGQRADGYHLLDSLVVFCGIGDRVSVSPAPTLALTITGPQAHLLTGGDDNLVMRAAQLFAPAGMGANIVLDKQLPLASGIGGGSADAAATLRALSQLWNRPLPDAAAILSLGADVPVCLSGHPARMRGVGDQTGPVPGLPGGMALLLVNPGVPLATPAVFNTLAEKDNPAMPVHLPPFASAVDLARWLATQRNDLEWPARKLAPVMDQVLNAIAQQPGALLARMSGSGATCFGLFAGAQGAEAAARALSRAHSGWWVQAGPILGAT